MRRPTKVVSRGFSMSGGTLPVSSGVGQGTDNEKQPIANGVVVCASPIRSWIVKCGALPPGRSSSSARQSAWSQLAPGSGHPFREPSNTFVRFAPCQVFQSRYAR